MTAPEEASALVVEIPTADPVVGGWRATHDPSADHGMPAHITLLYPFRPPGAIDAHTLAEALDAIGDHAAFTVTLPCLRCARKLNSPFRWSRIT